MTAITITKDLRGQFGPARDQDPRPTCIAFAVSDLHAALIPPWEPLSCEYLYYHAVQRSGAHPDDGVSVKAIGAALLHDGQTKESHWPYLRQLPPDLASWVPPPNPTPLFKRKHKLIPGTFKDAMDLVQADTPTIMVMSISDAFLLRTQHFSDSLSFGFCTRKIIGRIGYQQDL